MIKLDVGREVGCMARQLGRVLALIEGIEGGAVGGGNLVEQGIGGQGLAGRPQTGPGRGKWFSWVHFAGPPWAPPACCDQR
ncbi:hypothetical protein LP420_21445 [Massilia sp. B-10]|nr:hypothetical protein LP420_21445 [Massilia sp. B-10]UUZ52129.1 hypothetical protein LP419_20940 [Massilia sp. H-1]